MPTCAPIPRLRKRLVGFHSTRQRLPFYIGIDGDEQSFSYQHPVYVILSSDRSFLSSILIYGPSGSGKSITTRVLLENFFLEWKLYPEMWSHPIIVLDSKNNCQGINSSNRRSRDRFLLRNIHPKWNRTLKIPSEYIHIYLPAYVAPTEKRTVLRKMHKKWGAEGFWGVPWRHITDLAYLGAVLKVPSESLWSEELRPTFQKATLSVDVTLQDLIGVGGILEKASKSIKNKGSQGAALNFVDRWRHNRYWFSEKDVLAEHLTDPFSINVLSFAETPTMIYFNQLAFLIALESLMATLQESKVENQPIIVLHDVLNFLGRDKPFHNQIVDALRRLILTGQARTAVHGYVVIVETQSLDLPVELGDPRKYTVVLRLTWKSQYPCLKKHDFLGGVLQAHDNFNGFHCPCVVVRPPLTSYSV